MATARTTAACAARRRSSGFASRGSRCVISLIPSPHNLHNYDELGAALDPPPVRPTDEDARRCSALYPEMRTLLADWPEGDPPPGGGGRPHRPASSLATSAGRAWCPRPGGDPIIEQITGNSSVRSAVRSSRGSPAQLDSDAHTTGARHRDRPDRESGACGRSAIIGVLP